MVVPLTRRTLTKKEKAEARAREICQRKISYASLEAAERELPLFDSVWSAYPCRFCKRFHVTTKRKPTDKPTGRE